MSAPNLATLRALPPESLVPAGWALAIIAGLDGTGGDDGLGLTVAEVAERTGRAASTVRAWCGEKRLPGARRLRGREWRIPRSALAALLEDEAPERGGGAKRLEVPRGGLSAWRAS